MNNKLNFTKEQLYNGCLLAGVVHAIMNAHFPFLSSECSWDGKNYSRHNGSGDYGTISFSDSICVGAFRNHEKSERLFENERKAADYFEGADIIEFAENEALQYLLLDIDGVTGPVITTAFWGSNDEIYSKDNFDDFMSSGGDLIKAELMDTKQAFEYFADDYDCDINDQRFKLAKSIYNRKTADPNGRIILNKEEIAMIGSVDKEGMKESISSFREMNIQLDGYTSSDGNKAKKGFFGSLFGKKK